MPKPGYLISFPSADLIGSSRIGNLAEDLYRALRKHGLGDIPNEATASREVQGEVSSTRNLSRVLKTIKLELRRRNLDNDAVVTRMT